jgi:outer membrane protein OmpA-like peptidoglycan-associated protein
MSTRPGITAAALAAPLLLVPLAAGMAQGTAGPWDSATQRAAESAVERLGPKRALDIRPSILNIAGVQSAVGGDASAVAGQVEQVRQAMNDLGAKETPLEVRVELPADVLFDFDKAVIRPDAAHALGQLATVIRAYPKGHVVLDGYTDAVGKASYNQKLSERRAEAVKRWLVENGSVEATRLSTRGFGAGHPIASNATDAGRQKNRRVEAVISKGT